MHMDLGSCYHGILQPKSAEDLLMHNRVTIGAFLLWKTDQGQVDYIISVKESDLNCVHYIIPRRNSEDFFSKTLTTVFSYYRNNPLDCSPLGVHLTHPVTKPSVKTEKVATIIATNDYQAQNYSQLSFRKGEVLHLLDADNTEWWYARNGTDIGFIPSSYFQSEHTATNDNATGQVWRKVVPTANTRDSNPANEDTGNYKLERTGLVPNSTTNLAARSKMKFFRYHPDIDVENGNTTPKQEVSYVTNLSFVRCILENFKKLRSSPTINEECNGYRSYSIDDDIFDLNAIASENEKEKNNNVFSFGVDHKPRNISCSKSNDTPMHKTSITSSDDDVISVDHESDGSDSKISRNRPLPTYLYDRDVHPLPYNLSNTRTSKADCDLAKNRRSRVGSDDMSVKSEQISGRRSGAVNSRTRVSSVVEIYSKTEPEIENWSERIASRASKARSYYISGEDLSPDTIMNVSDASLFKNFSTISDDDVSTTDSGVDNTYCASSKCLPVSVRQVCEVWGEVGSAGGVIQVPGTGASLHLSPNIDAKRSKRSISTSNAHAVQFHRPGKSRLGSKTSERCRSVSDLNGANMNLDQEKDGRIVIGLEDPPDNINDRLQIVAGPMVRVDYANADVIKAGAVLQVDVNVTLKDSDEKQSSDDLQLMTSSFVHGNAKACCTFSCIQSESQDGPFREIPGCFYHYGNTLQVSISTRHLPSSSSSGQGGRLFLIPVVKLENKHRANPFLSVWDGVARKTFWVGIYGSKKLQFVSTCCVTLSSSGTCPPTLWITQSDNKKVLLHLWGSYHLPIDQMQDLHVALQTEDSSSLNVTPSNEYGSNIISEEEDIRRKSRINRLFILRHNNCEKNSPIINAQRPDFRNGNSGEGNSATSGLKQRNFLYVTITGLQNGSMYQMQVVTPQPERSLLCSTPVKRWKRTKPIAPPKTMLERRTAHIEEYLYLWYDAQRESKVKLRPAFEIPGADRLITSARMAIALKSRNRGKGHCMIMPHLAQYNQSEILPILGNDMLRAHGTNKYKEWYVGYSRRKIGLVHTKCVRILNFHEYCNLPDAKLTVSRVIENIIEPIGNLSYCYSTLRELLLAGVKDWLLFSSILRFGENYIEKVMSETEDESEQETNDKISLFIEKFKEYCITGPRKRSFQKEIIRALLYTEQYDLVSTLVADFCLLSVSVEIGQRWEELVDKLRDVGDVTQDSQPKQKCAKRNKSSDGEEKVRKEVVACHGPDKTELIEEATWRPAFDYLSCWRRQFGENNRAFLLYLHRAVDELTESPNRSWRCFTGAMMLHFATDSLKRYDTRL